MLSALLDLFFPRSCVHCLAYIKGGSVARSMGAKRLYALCEVCRATVAIERTFFCGKCRNRIPTGHRVSPCHPSFPYVLGAATRYADPAPRELILALKFRHVRDAARDLGGFLNSYLLATHYSPFDAAQGKLLTTRSVIVPIPLGHYRARQRGYNQAELIAREVALRLGLPLRTDILRRTRNTSPQSEARDHSFRKKNVAGAFSADPAKLPGITTIFLVDDVTTSGATLREAALALKAASPSLRIIALVA